MANGDDQWKVVSETPATPSDNQWQVVSETMATPDLRTGAGMEAQAQQQAKERIKQTIVPPKPANPPVYTGPGAWPPSSEQAQEKFLVKAVPALPMAGGAVGGALGGIPGAMAGGVAGESLRGLLQPEKAATTSTEAVKELAKAGLEQGAYETGGKAIGKIGEAVFKEGGAASKFINNILRADIKSTKFGANPATAILQDIPKSLTISELLSNTKATKQAVGAEIGKVIDTAPANVRIDYFKPVLDALSKIPNADAAGKAFDYISETAKSLGLNLSDLSAKDAFKFKEALQDGINFIEDPAVKNNLNSILSQRVYRPLSDALTSAVPGLKVLNKKYMNIKAAESVATKLDKLNTLGRIHPELHLDRPLAAIRDLVRGTPAVGTWAAKIGSDLNDLIQEIGAGNVIRLLSFGAKEATSGGGENNQPEPQKAKE